MIRRQTHIFLVLLVMLATSALALACPMCKDSIPSSDATQPNGLPSGFNVSVYTMLVGLFCMIGLVGTVIVKGVRSSTRAAITPSAHRPEK